MVHGYTFLRMDEHDSRRFITREGWDAYSPPGTFGQLDRLLDRHRSLEAGISPNSFEASLGGARELANASRSEFEEELFGIRAMRHVFKVKPNISLQAWMVLQRPMLKTNWGPQWIATLDDNLLPKASPVRVSAGRNGSPEYLEARAQGWTTVGGHPAVGRLVSTFGLRGG